MKYRFAMLFVLVLAVVMVSVPTLMAQDDAEVQEPTCTAEDLQANLDGLIDVMESVRDDVETTPDYYGLLLALEGEINNARYRCGYIEISSETHPNGIVGPLSFGGTLYQIDFEIIDGGGSFTTTTINGNCGIAPPSVFMVGGDGGTEAELATFENCTAMFEVNANEWSLTFTRLGG